MDFNSLGETSKVYVALDTKRNSSEVAIKKYKMTQQTCYSTFMELSVMKKMKHPNILVNLILKKTH